MSGTTKLVLDTLDQRRLARVIANNTISHLILRGLVDSNVTPGSLYERLHGGLMLLIQRIVEKVEVVGRVPLENFALLNMCSPRTVESPVYGAVRNEVKLGGTATPSDPTATPSPEDLDFAIACMGQVAGDVDLKKIGISFINHPEIGLIDFTKLRGIFGQSLQDDKDGSFGYYHQDVGYKGNLYWTCFAAMATEPPVGLDFRNEAAFIPYVLVQTPDSKMDPFYHILMAMRDFQNWRARSFRLPIYVPEFHHDMISANATARNVQIPAGARADGSLHESYLGELHLLSKLGVRAGQSNFWNAFDESNYVKLPVDVVESVHGRMYLQGTDLIVPIVSPVKYSSTVLRYTAAESTRSYGANSLCLNYSTITGADVRNALLGKQLTSSKTAAWGTEETYAAVEKSIENAIFGLFKNTVGNGMVGTVGVDDHFCGRNMAQYTHDGTVSGNGIFLPVAIRYNGAEALSISQLRTLTAFVLPIDGTTGPATKEYDWAYPCTARVRIGTIPQGYTYVQSATEETVSEKDAAKQTMLQQGLAEVTNLFAGGESFFSGALARQKRIRRRAYRARTKKGVEVVKEDGIGMVLRPREARGAENGLGDSKLYSAKPSQTKPKPKKNRRGTAAAAAKRAGNQGGQAAQSGPCGDKPKQLVKLLASLLM